MLSPGAIAGIVIGSIGAFLILIILPAWFCLYRRKATQVKRPQHGLHAPQHGCNVWDVQQLPHDFQSAPISLDPIPHRMELGDGPVNFGSMNVKGIRDMGDQEEDVFEGRGRL